MADVFHEVDEQLRSARFQSMVRRGWPYAAGLVVVALLIGLIAWGLNQHELAQASKASDRYAAAMDALQKGDVAGADRDFGDIARSGPRTYKALALMQQAGLHLRRDDEAGAIPLLDQATQAAPNPMLADVAALEAAYLVMNGGDYTQIRQRLLPLTGAGRPYRMMAREALAMAELSSGRVAEAKGDLQVISLSQDASEMAHNRASAALALIQSGGWTSIAPLAKASAHLKPQAPPPQAVASPQAAAAAQGQAVSQSSEPQAGAAQ